MIETVILAAVLTAAIHTVRAHRRLIAGVWREARWWQRALLVLALLPVPGPFDELVGLIVVKQIVNRRRS